jgi:hypothetical protein
MKSIYEIDLLSYKEYEALFDSHSLFLFLTKRRNREIDNFFISLIRFELKNQYSKILTENKIQLDQDQVKLATQILNLSKEDNRSKLIEEFGFVLQNLSEKLKKYKSLQEEEQSVELIQIVFFSGMSKAFLEYNFYMAFASLSNVTGIDYKELIKKCLPWDIICSTQILSTSKLELTDQNIKTILENKKLIKYATTILENEELKTNFEFLMKDWKLNEFSNNI